MTETGSIHRTVLLNETIDGLNLNPKSTVMDCTLGGGGHAREICKRYPGIKIIALDADEGALERAKASFKDSNCKVTFFNNNFRDLGVVLQKENLETVDAILFDLGFSSDQLENSGRGFSFLKDEPLQMTMQASLGEESLTAQEIVNTWSEENIADIIYGYGEERFARRIAKGIAEARKKTKIQTTNDLVKIIQEAVPKSYQRGRIHFATRTFQALRIAVNDELRTLGTGLEKGFKALGAGGRMATIAFHSLEDRIVKNFYKEKAKEGSAKLINKKPIVAKDEEIKKNNRARSAKLRIIEKK